jgi:hypothetical protein
VTIKGGPLVAFLVITAAVEDMKNGNNSAEDSILIIYSTAHMSDISVKFISFRYQEFAGYVNL